MDFQLSQEQEMVRQMVQGFVEKEVRPLASSMDREGHFPRDLLKKLAALGLMGAYIPPEYGGAGMELVSYVIAMEELSKAWASLGVIMTVNNSLVCDPIHRFGTESQKQRYLKPLARGERLGCYALTEPGAGSDAGAIKTRARRENGGYTLNGSKIFITNGQQADLAIVYAVTAQEQGKHGISAFLVEKGTPGFLVGKLEDKMGLRSSDTAELIFQDCHVPPENLLGVENEGFKIALSTLDGGRIGIAAQALGIAQACLEEATRYARERHQFGRPIGDFEAIRFMLADMAMEIQAARLLTYRAAHRRQQGPKITLHSAQAKLLASEMANRVAYKAVQIFGGYGYIKDFPVERYYRDARITTLYEGTSEIQRLVIARELLKHYVP
ncbi:MAG TPA: acyl-CoA dehydrogenase [Nitrospiria bacterium]|nr:acyl-CoA dehydrogenase [Nitrospiria bacterium]